MIYQVEHFSVRTRLIALALGAVCLAFGQGRWPIPVAAWIAPIMMIAFVRPSRWWVGLLGFVLAHTVAWEIAYMGMVRMPMLARWGMFLGLSLIPAAVFLGDRWASQLSRSFWTTFILPCGWVTFEFLLGRFSPNGSWGSLAYTFTDHYSLVQVVSLVGWTGVSFLIMWVASVLHWLVREVGAGRNVRREFALTMTVILGVLVFGGLRLSLHPSPNTVRVASLVGPSSFIENDEFRRDVWAYTRGIELPPDEVEAARLQIRRTMQAHMELAERELRNGARIVSFPEANPSITAREESEWVEAAAALAAEYDAYVGLGLFVFRPEDGLPAVNKYVLLDPEGSIAWDYWKSRLVPGSSHVVGDGTLPDLETDHGRLSAAICFDMDFPGLLAQAGRYRTDIVLAPSNDWTEVRAIHARMATMRAVEQGFNLVRPTKDGYAIATDAMGRVIAWQDTDRPGNHVMIAEVPTAGAATLYSATGDLFAWACAATLLLILGIARARRLD